MKTLPDELIREIADILDESATCFCHKETLELIPIPLDNPYFDESMYEKELEDIEENRENYYVFKPLGSRESFQIMEEFVDNLDDSDKVKDKLYQAIS